jgi:zinc-binding alcohol dehydrogenase family protein
VWPSDLRIHICLVPCSRGPHDLWEISFIILFLPIQNHTIIILLERLTKLAQWADQNKVKVNIDKTFSLDEAAKALDYQKDAHPRGKVVLTV